MAIIVTVKPIKSKKKKWSYVSLIEDMPEDIEVYIRKYHKIPELATVTSKFVVKGEDEYFQYVWTWYETII